MPELPEVETIRRHLAPRVDGRTLVRLEVSDPRLTLPLRPEAVTRAVEGRRVERLGRRGKYLVWELEGDVFLLLHLRMTGTLLLADHAPYERARFELAGATLAFSDPRRFGTAELAIGGPALEAFLGARLGLEPFDPGFTAEHLHGLTRASRAPAKAFLLDQRKVAGVGNIYADEALHRARIHPLRPAARLTRGQVAALRDAVVAALADGVEAKGATIDDFRHPDGVQGSFQDRFLVHRRAGEPCPTCGTLVRKLTVGGRGTYVCETCQPRPRPRARRASPPARTRPAPGSRRSAPRPR